MRPSPIPIRRRILYSLSILMLVSMVAEAGARLIWSDEDLVMNPTLTYLRDEPTLLWSMRPQVDIELDGFHLQTNSLGLRDHEIAQPKPEDRVRILSLGESTTWGHGVALEETYGKVLETLLSSGNEDFEVINAGVAGYTTWQSAVYLEERGLDLQPDVVMLYHLKNDSLPRGVIDENNFLYQVPYTDAETYRMRRPVRYLLSGLYRSHLYLRLRQAVLRLPSDLPDAATSRERHEPRMTPEERTEALWWIHKLCSERGIRLIVLFPTYHQHPGHDYVLRDFARLSDTPLIRLPERKAASGISNEAYYLDEVHPSAEGHALIAQWIHEALEAQGPGWWDASGD